jgi:hypothetical protein
MALPSLEVRWFLPGSVEDNKPMEDWIRDSHPLAQGPALKSGKPVGLEWEGRMGGMPDVYLLDPTFNDMSIKWRDDQLQIKGKVASLGTSSFCKQYRGIVQRWIKWSYKRDSITQSFKELFDEAKATAIPRAYVGKRRLLRKVRVDSVGHYVEVAATEPVDRGLYLELTEISIKSAMYSSIAFEGFMDDTQMYEDFPRLVELFLDSLKKYTPSANLDVTNSLSYPEWLINL